MKDYSPEIGVGSRVHKTGLNVISKRYRKCIQWKNTSCFTFHKGTLFLPSVSTPHQEIINLFIYLFSQSCLHDPYQRNLMFNRDISKTFDSIWIFQHILWPPIFFLEYTLLDVMHRNVTSDEDEKKGKHKYTERINKELNVFLNCIFCIICSRRRQ